ncbi:MAG: preprotein translocase subunit SecE [Proteobacteria bacterium]|jgi:preprotein translocase subunit SecE|nr:preprotein translocase subunit SecE [Pseudomonadota bacterium]
MADKIKLLVAVLIIAAGIGGYYYFVDQPQLYRLLGLLVVIGLSAFVALQSQPGKASWAFAQSAVLEIRKCVWPTRQETVQTTLLVVVMVIIMGVMLWLFDMLLLWAVKLLTGQGG